MSTGVARRRVWRRGGGRWAVACAATILGGAACAVPEQTGPSPSADPPGPAAGGGATGVDGGLVVTVAPDAGADAALPVGAGVIDDVTPVASAIQVNAAHTGSIDDPALAGPIVRTWDVNVEGSPSYPLIARGLVYFAVRDGPAAGVEALDRRTGAKVWGPIDFGGGTAGPVYEAGRVFVVSGRGVVEAFDSATGAQLWIAQMPKQWSFGYSPTAYKGVLYFGGAGDSSTLYAVDETSGTVLWTYPDVSPGTPAVSDDGVFVVSDCVPAERLDRLSPARLWVDAPNFCQDGLDGVATLFDARVFGFGRIFNSSSGTPLGVFSSDAVALPAFHGSLGFFVDSGSVYAEDATSIDVWSSPTGGVTSPLVVGGRVYVGAGDGVLHALDEQTGAEVWSDDLSADFPGCAPAGTSCQAWSQGPYIATALAAAEGTLVVPAGTHVVAYASESTRRDAGAPGDSGGEAGLPSDGGFDAPLR